MRAREAAAREEAYMAEMAATEDAERKHQAAWEVERAAWDAQCQSLVQECSEIEAAAREEQLRAATETEAARLEAGAAWRAASAARVACEAASQAQEEQAKQLAHLQHLQRITHEAETEATRTAELQARMQGTDGGSTTRSWWSPADALVGSVNGGGTSQMAVPAAHLRPGASPQQVEVVLKLDAPLQQQQQPPPPPQQQQPNASPFMAAEEAHAACAASARRTEEWRSVGSEAAAYRTGSSRAHGAEARPLPASCYSPPAHSGREPPSTGYPASPLRAWETAPQPAGTAPPPPPSAAWDASPWRRAEGATPGEMPRGGAAERERELMQSLELRDATRAEAEALQYGNAIDVAVAHARKDAALRSTLHDSHRPVASGVPLDSSRRPTAATSQSHRHGASHRSPARAEPESEAQATLEGVHGVRRLASQVRRPSHHALHGDWRLCPLQIRYTSLLHSPLAIHRSLTHARAPPLLL